MLKSKKAFTLIELLVVIAIIGILATISVLALSNARAKSRDAKRVGDAKQVQTALELFFNDQGRYPTTAEWNSGQIYSTTTGSTSTYMQMIPASPTPADGGCSDEQNIISYYQTESGASYNLSICLGNTTGALVPGPKCLTPSGIVDASCASSCGVCANSGVCINNECFDPSSVPNLFSWYDASGLVNGTDNSYGTVSGGTVTNWKDVSGNNRHLFGTYNNTNPSLGSSLSYFNNKPGLVFSGANDKGHYPTQYPIMPPFTVFVVYNQQVGTGYDIAFFLGGNGFFNLLYNNDDGKLMINDGYVSAGVSAPTPPFSALVSGVADSANSQLHLYVNGALAGSSSFSTYQYSPYSIILGANFWGSTLNGAIAEIVIYNSLLSESERQAVETYLNDKYNLY